MDHAEDQKKLCRILEDWKKLCKQERQGEAAFNSASIGDDIHAVLWEEIKCNICNAGGDMSWEALSDDEKRKCEDEAYWRVCACIGQEKIDAMTPEQRQYIKLFLWGGCCMHKEMNAVKGGNACMTAFWKVQGLVGPIKLVNKDNCAVAVSGDSVTKERVTEADKKKGQQDALQIYMESIIGYMICFPNTSNTRYQALCKAAAELITKLDLYRQFLELVRNLKDKCTFTNMEKNVFDALFDVPTLTELCVLVLYSQSISHLYMRKVRGMLKNLLDLALYETGVLDGKPWERPDVFYAVQRLAPQLPHLEGTLIAFLEGARDTWVHFTSEFEEGGKIASASTSEKRHAFMKPTNNDNEGVFRHIPSDFRTPSIPFPHPISLPFPLSASHSLPRFHAGLSIASNGDLFPIPGSQPHTSCITSPHFCRLPIPRDGPWPSGLHTPFSHLLSSSAPPPTYAPSIGPPVEMGLRIFHRLHLVFSLPVSSSIQHDFSLPPSHSSVFTVDTPVLHLLFPLSFSSSVFSSSCSRIIPPSILFLHPPPLIHPISLPLLFGLFRFDVLGAYWVNVQNNPRLSIAQHNACMMYQKNNTSAFMQMHFTPAHHRSIMRQAREEDAAQLPAKLHTKQVAEWQRVDKEKHARDARQKERTENKAAKEGPVVRVVDLPRLLIKPPTIPVLKGHSNWY
ncbi:hypothetical protein BOTBODRAFT_175306 [Botryobasidium botryosum FD-172 SS1]|uniref:Uncharacterized protein n=1 Tax=Botryobasidium botryosum (strain FD-172 SS1) TaxID=930990 RepID=A0A067MEE1_BOTB1|nr:hypothetical protein BOTBODRAFT_175306 [Botryobasidium botryosum FD-172 SS1]